MGICRQIRNVKVSYQYDKVTEFNEYGFAGILKDKKWGVLNKDGSVLIEPTYNFRNSSTT